jgi:hypothetical protein
MDKARSEKAESSDGSKPMFGAHKQKKNDSFISSEVDKKFDLPLLAG